MKDIFLLKKLMQKRFHTRTPRLTFYPCIHHILKNCIFTLLFSRRIILVPHCFKSTTIHFYKVIRFYCGQRGSRALYKKAVITFKRCVSSTCKNIVGVRAKFIAHFGKRSEFIFKHFDYPSLLIISHFFLIINHLLIAFLYINLSIVATISLKLKLASGCNCNGLLVIYRDGENHS